MMATEEIQDLVKQVDSCVAYGVPPTDGAVSFELECPLPQQCPLQIEDSEEPF